MSASSDTQLDWAAHQSKIKELYWIQDKELPEVMKTMEGSYGFVATKKMYKKYIKAWGFQKNITTSEMIAMIEIQERRRRQNKETSFNRHGRIVDPGKLRRFERRRKLRAHGATGTPSEQQVTTPPGIIYTTPEPEPLNGSLLPTPVPYAGPRTNEAEEMAALENSGVAHDPPLGPDACLSPSSRATMWPPPILVPETLDGEYTGSPSVSPLPVMNNHLIPSAFSRQLDISHDLSHADVHTTLSPSPWLEPAKETGYQVFHDPKDGVPHWIFISPPQHTGHHMPTLTSDYSSDLTQAMFGMPSDFNTTGATLDHTALHNAVIDNNFDLAKALLEGGADPNRAARGGTTPLHYAACQRNIGLVRLLRDYGASLDAVTDKGRSILFFAVRSQARLGSSDMLPYANHPSLAYASHTDEVTMDVIDTLYNFPAGWARLLRWLGQADKDGMTPLMMAAEAGFTQAVTMFLQRGAPPDARDHAGHTALKYAASGNHRHLVRMLLQADPRVEARDLSHLIKLVNRNLTVGDLEGVWDGCHNYHPALIAKEVVRLCREKSLLDGLLRLAKQKRKGDVLELLLSAMAQLDMEEQGQGAGS